MKTFRASCVSLCLAVGCFCAATSRGELFTFDVPGLAGFYQNSGTSLTLTLGKQFSGITGVSMRLKGTHAPGLYGDLNFPGFSAYPAELTGWFPELAYPATAGFDSVLSKNSGTFDKTFPFHRWLPPKVDDFSLLLDGVADFSFGVGSPALLGTAYIISFPSATIASAQLLVEGTALAPVIPIAGDYNSDGTVDDSDMVLWRNTFGSSFDLRADGNGDGIVDAADFTAWRDQLPTSGAGSAAVAGVPEPSALLLASLACCLSLSQRRRRSTAAA
jgi:hypothetical protein